MKHTAFTVSEDLRGTSGLPRISAHNLSLEQCRRVRGIVCNQYSGSTDYQLGHACGRFLQGYQEPFADASDGWVLVEFWTDNPLAIKAFVEHINKELRLL